ncbi:MAG: DUF362 domain-containing protein [Deltaproteobacteria bacterium]|nr:DUF362 domain-containing protein [Deltaproteobacteria bacterium]
MASKVFFADMRASLKRNFPDKIRDLIEQVGLAQRIKPGGLTAIKIHFGEKGNTAYIRPVYARIFVDAVRAARGKPFLTDANTLYVGTRSDSVSHLTTATENGFAYSVVGAPLIIADGLRGDHFREVPVNLPECEVAYIGAEVVDADCLISLAHFKGHELAGFGGTNKNLGMGAASRHGKLFQHSDITPAIMAEKCIACGACIRRCPASAIKFTKRGADEPAPEHAQNPELRAVKDPEKCIGCGDCVLTCPEGAIQIQWNAEIPAFLRRMTAYTKGVLTGKEDHAVFFNFITDVSPACDCYPFQDAAIVSDIGVLASTDPVAIDQAAVDLVNQAPGLGGSCLKHECLAPGSDKFRSIYPHVDWSVQLAYGQEIGLGSREYELLTV